MTDQQLREKVFAGEALQDILIVDSHAHIGPYKEFRMLDYSPESLLKVMDRIGIDVTFISSIPGCIGGLYKEWNCKLIEAAIKWPGRFMGYMSVNPAYPEEAANELKRCYDSGLRAIKVHRSLGISYDDPVYRLVWEFAERFSLPVLAHTWGWDGIAQLSACFRQYPTVTWILAHGGSADRSAYVDAALKNRNVYVDTVLSSGPRGMIEFFVKSGLTDKLLWGTDATFMNTPHQLGKIIFADIAIEQKRKILGENAVNVFGLRKKCFA